MKDGISKSKLGIPDNRPSPILVADHCGLDFLNSIGNPVDTLVEWIANGDAPNAAGFSYTFDNLSAHVEALLLSVLGLKKFSIYVQDYGAPVGYRIASKHPEAIEAIVVQNGNAYVEGIGSAFDPMKPFWAKRNAETEKPVRALLTSETTAFQYTHGAKNTKQISPDNWTFDQIFLDRPGNAAIQLDLLYDYKSNLGQYERWHEYFRTSQPRMLILWGRTIRSSPSKARKPISETWQRLN